MKHLVETFQKNVGKRGVTFYDEEGSNFLTWMEVLQFLDSLPSDNDKVDPFSEKLAGILANYDPDSEFLAVQQCGDAVSVELYTRA